MRLSLQKTSRRPSWPAWAVAIVAAWLVLVIASVVVQQITGRPFTPCLFKNVTGISCPSCGSTRMMLSLLAGKPLRAFLYNPMVFVAGALLAVALTVRLVAARTVQLRFSPVERKWLWAAFVVAVAANWAYVVRFVGQ